MTSALIIIITGILACLNLALIGNFLILKKKAMLIHAISHSVLPGIILAFALSGGLDLLSTLIASVVSAFLSIIVISLLENDKINPDSSIAIVYSFMTAISIFTISVFFPNSHIDLDAVLLGHIEFSGFRTLEFFGTNIGPESWWQLGGLLILNLIFISLFYKEMVVSTFDKNFAKVSGFKPKVIETLFLMLISINAVVCFSAIGTLLTLAFIVIPTGASYLLNKNLIDMILTSLVFSILSSIAGYFLAVEIDLPISATMATMMTFLFILIFGINKLFIDKPKLSS